MNPIRILLADDHIVIRKGLRLLLESQPGFQVIAEASKVIPVRRVGQPRDIANVICFLASDEASFVNGQIIYVAGGPRS